MKRCPQCNRSYADETQNFCLEDGTWLAAAEEAEAPATAIFPGSSGNVDAPTRPQLTSTNPTQILPSSNGDTDWKKRSGLIVAAVLILVLSGVGAWMYRSSDARPKSTISLRSAEISRLTSSGKVTGAVISPDGKYVAHLVDDGGQQSIWMRQIATASNMQLVPPGEVAYTGLAFTPDGNYVYYSAYDRSTTGILYQVPVLGGTPRKLLTGISGSVAFSPDSRQLAYFKSSGLVDEVMIANADGSGSRLLATRSGDEQFFRGSLSSLSWSLDGKTIAAPLRNFPENYMSVCAISVETGEVKPLTTRRWFEVKQVAWLADGTGALIAAQDSANAEFKIWHISYPSGETEKITNDLDSYRSVSLAADNSALATVQAQRNSDLWVMPANDSARAVQVTHDRNFQSRVAWTPDGRLLYNTNATGNFDIHLMDADGNNSRQLTANAGWNGDASMSADGRTVFFMSDRTGPPHIWSMGSDGGNQKQLTTEAFNVRPTLSPDGQWILYASSAKQGWYIWKMPVTGGTPVQVTQQLSDYPTFSPDGTRFACYYWKDSSSPVGIAILSIEGGEPLKVFTPALAAGRETNLEWSADGRAIVYGATKNGVANLWSQPVDGGDPKQITNFNSERILWFDFSPDGKRLAVSRGTVTSDVVLIKNFR